MVCCDLALHSAVEASPGSPGMGASVEDGTTGATVLVLRVVDTCMVVTAAFVEDRGVVTVDRLVVVVVVAVVESTSSTSPGSPGVGASVDDGMIGVAVLVAVFRVVPARVVLVVVVVAGMAVVVVVVNAASSESATSVGSPWFAGASVLTRGTLATAFFRTVVVVVVVFATCGARELVDDCDAANVVVVVALTARSSWLSSSSTRCALTRRLSAPVVARMAVARACPRPL